MCKLFKSYEEILHLGVCKLAKYVSNCVVSAKIYTADKNFTRPPVAAVATYFNSGKKFHNYLGMVGHRLRQFFPSAYTVCCTILQKMINLVKWSNMLYNNEMTFTLKSLGPLTATRKSLDVLSPRKKHFPYWFFYV